MNLSFSTTATCRPDIIEECYSSFVKNLHGVDFEEIDLYINIDPAPAGVDPYSIVDVAQKYFGHVHFNIPETPNFTRAINWCWSQPTSGYLFHLEDDWILLRVVQVGDMIRLFKNNSLYQVALRAYPYDYDKICLSPGVFSRTFYSSIANKLDTSLNPEVQLRGVVCGLDLSKKRVKAYSKSPIIKDIGRKWIDKTHLSRPNVKRDFVKWVDK